MWPLPPKQNRKNDETAYMQMLKLKRDLTKAWCVRCSVSPTHSLPCVIDKATVVSFPPSCSSLTDMVKERERKKQELAQICMEVFKKRYSVISAIECLHLNY